MTNYFIFLPETMKWYFQSITNIIEKKKHYFKYIRRLESDSSSFRQISPGRLFENLRAHAYLPWQTDRRTGRQTYTLTLQLLLKTTHLYTAKSHTRDTTAKDRNDSNFQLIRLPDSEESKQFFATVAISQPLYVSMKNHASTERRILSKVGMVFGNKNCQLSKRSGNRGETFVVSISAPNKQLVKESAVSVETKILPRLNSSNFSAIYRFPPFS